MEITQIPVDTHLVPGLRLPTIPGLPGPKDGGIYLHELIGPPAPDSLRGRADALAVRTAQRMRTPEGDAWAIRLAKDGDLKVWLDFAKRARGDQGVVQGWLGTALLAAGLAANAAVTYAAKRTFDRPRPFQADPSIVPLGPVPKTASYPSGHASSAFAAARIISSLDPSLTKEAYNLATQVAASRVYAGVHYPTDVVAGALLGTGIAESVLRTPGRAVPSHGVSGSLGGATAVA